MKIKLKKTIGKFKKGEEFEFGTCEGRWIRLKTGKIYSSKSQKDLDINRLLDRICELPTFCEILDA